MTEEENFWGFGGTDHMFTGALRCNMNEYCKDVQEGAGKMTNKHTRQCIND